MAENVSTVFKELASGSIQLLKQALKGTGFRDISYDAKDCNDRGFLHYVCIFGTDEKALWALSLEFTTYGVGPYRTESKHFIPWNTKDKFGATPVMYAARSGMIGFVKEIIKKYPYSANVKDKDNRDRNIFHYLWGVDSIFRGVPDIRRQLCDNETMEELCRIFMESEVDLFHPDKKRRDPVYCALESRSYTVLVYILSDHSRTRQLWVKRLYHTIALLSTHKIYHRVVLNTKPLPVLGDFIHLCLWECFQEDPTTKKRREIIEDFQTTVRFARLNVNEPDDNGRTALHHLCYYQFDTEPYGLREGLVAKLLELGADPNMTDIRGCTPLMCAVDRGYVDAEDLNDNQHETGIAKLLKTNQTCEEKAIAEGNEKTNKEESELVKENKPSN